MAAEFEGRFAGIFLGRLRTMPVKMGNDFILSLFLMIMVFQSMGVGNLFYSFGITVACFWIFSFWVEKKKKRYYSNILRFLQFSCIYAYLA